jgi:hypothetical protein
MERLKSSDRHQPRDARYEAALDAALGELERASEELRQRRNDMGELEARVVALSSLAESLMATLPPDKREYFRQLAEGRSGQAIRHKVGSPVYENVVQLFKNSGRKVWSAPEVRKALNEDGLSVDAPRLHNVLSYLARKGFIKRISRGRYYINGTGAAFYTSDEIGE